MASEIPSTAVVRAYRRRYAFWMAGLLLFTSGLWGALTWWRVTQIQYLQSECARWQAERNWPKLLVAAQEWRSLEPRRREALQAGAAAGKELRQPASTAEFLQDFPHETKDDVPWLSTLADLQFGPLHNPAAGAKTCVEILRLDPQSATTRQRLIFFYAVTAQTVELLAAVHDAAENHSDLPEFYVYAFLADGLKLSNALDRIQQWMRGGKREELLMVAYALNTARNLEGGVPPVDEAEAAALRKRQEQRANYLQQLRSMFPQNHQMLAYDLVQAVETGQALSVADALSRATPIADGDYRFWRARGWLLLRTGDLNGAHEAFAEALRLHPLDWRTRYYFANWARRSSELPLAEQQYRLAADGKKLETDLLGMADVHGVSPNLLRRLAEFAETCGDELTAARLRRHFADAARQDVGLDASATIPAEFDP